MLSCVIEQSVSFFFSYFFSPFSYLLSKPDLSGIYNIIPAIAKTPRSLIAFWDDAPIKM